MIPFPNIYVGFSGALNFGDYWLYEIIKEELAEARLCPFGRIPKARIRNLILAMIRRGFVKSPTLGILGGGTLLIPNVPEFLQTIESIRSIKYSIGTGAKSLDELNYYNLGSGEISRLQSVYAPFKEITVRGPISKAAFEAVVGQKAQIVGDPLLSLARDGASFAGSESAEVVVLNVANLTHSQKRWWKPAGGTEFDLYREIITDSRKLGLKLKLMHCAPEDASLASDLAAEFDLPPSVAAMDVESLDAVLAGRISLIATRLHSMIFAVARGIPVATLAYADKHLDFLYSVAWPEKVPRLSEMAPGSVMEQVRAMWGIHDRAHLDIAGRIGELNASRKELYGRILGTLSDGSSGRRFQ